MPRVFRLLRPRQWTKNALLFAALVFAEKLFVPEALLRACLAFVCFCLASSSGYVINDLVDAERDREHPEKRHRPIASGEVGRQPALLLAIGLAVGALALGAALGTIAVIVRQEIVLFIMGGVFVVETLSVMIQVASFKLTGKRVFRMAPIHHHYELKGWKENQVVVRFWIITMLLVLFGLSTLKLR
jgi:hypothetical protein